MKRELRHHSAAGFAFSFRTRNQILSYSSGRMDINKSQCIGEEIPGSEIWPGIFCLIQILKFSLYFQLGDKGEADLCVCLPTCFSFMLFVRAARGNFWGELMKCILLQY